jgi:hypothetical protein
LLAVGVILIVTAALTRPASRRVLSVAACVAIVVGLAGWETGLALLHRWGDELQDGRRTVPTIVLNEQEHVYTAALTRVYLFDVYGAALRRAGWLGFGTDRTTGFPPRVPFGAQHAKTLKQMFAVDDAYVLVTLRFGYLGVLVFALLGIAAAVRYARLALQPRIQGAVFFAGMAGGVLGTMLLLVTVWMPHDFGFWYLWTVGAAASCLPGGREGNGFLT